MKHQTVSIIIPNYNGRGLLEKNLAAVKKACPTQEIIIVDDGSEDDSVRFLSENYPDIKLIRIAVNHGYATTVNLGVKAAGGDIVVLLNTDVQPRSDFLNPLVKPFSDKNVFAVGCLDNSRENGQTITRGRGVGKFNRGFLEHGRGDTRFDNTLWVSGGSGAFRKRIWEKLGGLDPLYDPFYWEDLDLGYRALRSGYKLVFEAKSQVEHFHEQGIIKSKYSQTEINSIAYRNQFIFVWKNITDSTLLISHWLWLPWTLFKALTNGNWPLLKGFFEAVKSISEIRKRKRKQRTTFTRSDMQVLADFSTDKHDK